MRHAHSGQLQAGLRLVRHLMVPTSYHSCREELGNYLQIKVMLSDSGPYKNMTSVSKVGKQTQESQINSETISDKDKVLLPRDEDG